MKQVMFKNGSDSRERGAGHVLHDVRQQEGEKNKPNGTPGRIDPPRPKPQAKSADEERSQEDCQEKEDGQHFEMFFAMEPQILVFRERSLSPERVRERTKEVAAFGLVALEALLGGPDGAEHTEGAAKKTER
jgi:hypothetical protein